MTIGVLGGGQLGRMLALAGVPLGLSFRFLDPSADSPAAEVGELEQRYRQSQNGSRLVENANQAVDLLSAASANLGNAQRCLRELERFDPSVTERLAGLLHQHRRDAGRFEFAPCST